jgi:hypothetical protein
MSVAATPPSGVRASLVGFGIGVCPKLLLTDTALTCRCAADSVAELTRRRAWTTGGVMRVPPVATPA